MIRWRSLNWPRFAAICREEFEAAVDGVDGAWRQFNSEVLSGMIAQAERTGNLKRLNHLNAVESRKIAEAWVWTNRDFRWCWLVVKVHERYKNFDPKLPGLSSSSQFASEFSIAVAAALINNIGESHDTQPAEPPWEKLVPLTDIAVSPPKKGKKRTTSRKPVPAPNKPALPDPICHCIARAPEFVLFYLAVLQGPEPEKHADKQIRVSVGTWNLAESKRILTNMIYESVFYTIDLIYKVLWDLFDAKCSDLVWAEYLTDLMIQALCPCSLSYSIPHENPHDDRSNAAKRHATCVSRHQIRAWHHQVDTMHEVTLWNHLQRAVKGYLGRMQTGGLPSGMFFGLLHVECGLNHGKLAHHQCDQCDSERWCNSKTCRIDHRIPDPPHVTCHRCLVVDGRDFEKVRCWKCVACEGCSNRDNYYRLERCADCREPHAECDKCPRCGRFHPTGRAGRPSTLYFYRSAPLNIDVETDDKPVPTAHESLIHRIPEADRPVFLKLIEGMTDAGKIARALGWKIEEVEASIKRIIEEFRDDDDSMLPTDDDDR